MYSMRKVLFVAAATVGLLGSGAAQATTATNLGNANVGIYLKGNPSGSQLPTITDVDQTIYLEDNNAGANLGYGNIGTNADCTSGSPCVNFSSTSLLDFANGNAVITAHDGDVYHDLTIEVPGYTFGDLYFGVQLSADTDQDLQIQVFTGLGSPAADVAVPSTDLGNGLNSFLVITPDVSVSTTTSSLMTKIVLTSTYGLLGVEGFDQTKQFSISSVNAVPLPGALPLMASGLGALGLLGWRRKRKKAMAAA